MPSARLHRPHINLNCCLCVQARHKQNGELAALKVVKMEPGEDILWLLLLLLDSYFILLIQHQSFVTLFISVYILCCLIVLKHRW